MPSRRRPDDSHPRSPGGESLDRSGCRPRGAGNAHASGARHRFPGGIPVMRKHCSQPVVVRRFRVEMQPSSAGAGTFERSDGPRSSMRSRSSFPGLLAFVFGAAVAAIPLAPAPARACYNEVVLKIDPNAVALAEAEAALKRGEPARAARRVLSRYSNCLLYTSPSPRDRTRSRMPSSA